VRAALALAAALALGCAGTAMPVPETPRQTYAVALTAYTSAALAMAEWCAPPTRAASGACADARLGARAAMATLDEIEASVRAGTITEEQYQRAADRLTALAAILRAQGGDPL